MALASWFYLVFLVWISSYWYWWGLSEVFTVRLTFHGVACVYSVNGRLLNRWRSESHGFHLSWEWPSEVSLTGSLRVELALFNGRSWSLSASYFLKRNRIGRQLKAESGSSFLLMRFLLNFRFQKTSWLNQGAVWISACATAIVHRF